MNTITIEVEDSTVLAGLKKVLKAMRGVKIVSKRKRSGLEEALDDVSKGNITEYSSSEEMFEKLGI